MIFPSHCLVYENRERGMCFPSLAFPNRIKTLSGIKIKRVNANNAFMNSCKKECLLESIGSRISVSWNIEIFRLAESSF